MNIRFRDVRSLLPLLAAAFLLTGCGSSPEEVAKAYVNACLKNDYAAYASLSSNPWSKDDFEYEYGGRPIVIHDFRVLRTQRDGDLAVVTVDWWTERPTSSQPDNKKDRIASLLMEKVDGKWRVRSSEPNLL